VAMARNAFWDGREVRGSGDPKTHFGVDAAAERWRSSMIHNMVTSCIIIN